MDDKQNDDFKITSSENSIKGPSFAFVGATWAAFVAGVVAYNVGLYNASMQLNEKGYYFTIILYGLFSAVSVQKSVRDKEEGLPVSSLYYGLSWFSVIVSIALLVIGLFNATLALSEKGFYGMSFALALFAAITIQKNIRDSMATQK